MNEQNAKQGTSAEESARVRDMVREGYARIAGAESAEGVVVKGGCCGSQAQAAVPETSRVSSCCGESRAAEPAREAPARAVQASSCCGSPAESPAREAASAASCCGAPNVDVFARALGYTSEELGALPEGANLGLSCGNPTALASLKPGEVVVDLGAGAGFDALIASKKVGPEGRVIGVDMTPEMLSRARRNAVSVGADNVEFRLGEIESLPVADASVDVVISNCVINLSPDKPRVFREIARVLRPGGRVAVSDMALLRPLPEAVRADVLAYVGCVAGAVLVDEYLDHMRAAGLAEIEVEPVGAGEVLDAVQDPLYQKILEKLPAGTRPEQYVASVRVQARKPAA